MKKSLVVLLAACMLLSVGLVTPRETAAALPIIEPLPILPALDLNLLINTKAVYTIPLYRR